MPVVEPLQLVEVPFVHRHGLAGQADDCAFDAAGATSDETKGKAMKEERPSFLIISRRETI